MKFLTVTNDDSLEQGRAYIEAIHSGEPPEPQCLECARLGQALETERHLLAVQEAKLRRAGDDLADERAARELAEERAHDLARLLDQARHAAELDRARIAELELNDQEIDSLFELRWQADHRAIERWRAATGREFVRPDHADLCVWLMDRIVELERSLEKSQTVIALEREARQMTQDRLNERIAELEEEAQLFRHVSGVAAETAGRIAAAEARIAELEPLAEVGRRKLLEGRPDVERDWACAQCRPESDIITPGFECHWHRALRAAGIGEDAPHV